MDDNLKALLEGKHGTFTVGPLTPQDFLQQIADSGMPGSLYAQLCLIELAQMKEGILKRRRRHRRQLVFWIVFTLFSISIAVYGAWRLLASAQF